MFGLIGKMRAQPGQRDALAKLMLSASEAMPGCLSYIIAKDESDLDALWITETWEDEQSHKASLSLPQVQEAIGKARPLIAGFDSQTRTVPIGGIGLPETGR
ncbi:putative quinol monooxygenase [Chelativorans sp. YIM 93263]|uniref:putative quinol monooxygenase n=1 Tax=Chelativorans sp. YIM 93263 TaxID=2906648 RepID=UPI0023783280|nr:putative quinol monooxygenase [Chelativorans sp. YIM 93263]